MSRKFIVILIIISLLVIGFQTIGAQTLTGDFKNGLQSLQYYTSSIDKIIPGLKPLEAAISQFKSSISDNLNIDESLLFIALIYQELGNFDQSLDYLAQYLERNPDDSWIHVLRGDLWYEIGDEKMALACYELALDQGEYAKGYYGVGLIKMGLGQEEAAIDAFANSVSIAPDFVEARIQLATLCYNHGEFEEALEHFELVVLFDPQLADAHYYLSLLYEEKGEYEKAQHARDMAVSYDASYAVLLE